MLLPLFSILELRDMLAPSLKVEYFPSFLHDGGKERDYLNSLAYTMRQHRRGASFEI